MQVKVSAIDKTAEQYEALLEHEDYYAAKVANLKPDSRRRLEILATRCLLKEMLHSEQIVSYDQYGAPSLTGLGHYVSISHTDGYVAVALADKPVGIDIEYIDDSRNFCRLADRFFKGKELEAFNNSHNALTFYEIWTKKEAYSKILGSGTAELFKGFDVFSLNNAVFHTEQANDYIITLCEKAD